MTNILDVAAKRAIDVGLITVDAELGEVRKSNGERAEVLDKRTGYGRVYVGGTSSGYAMAHRVVWIAKHGLIPSGLQVNHINKTRWDNRIENLELVTPGGNVRHAHGNLGYDAVGTTVDVSWLDTLSPDHRDNNAHEYMDFVDGDGYGNLQGAKFRKVA